MKTQLVLATAAALGLASAASAATYSGNGASGFGGPVGNGSLTVTADATNVNFTLNVGPGGDVSGNSLVLYIDSVAGGVNDTSTLTDTSDGGRTAISGLNNSEGRTLATFAPGFTADFAISAEAGNFAGLFNLSTPSNFGFVSSGNIMGPGTGPVTFSFARTDLGLPATGDVSFSFEGTLISTSAFRSNETIGASTSTDPNGGTGNPGFTGTTTFSAANVFTTAVPEPTSLGLLGLGGLTLLRRRR